MKPLMSAGASALPSRFAMMTSWGSKVLVTRVSLVGSGGDFVRRCGRDGKTVTRPGDLPRPSLRWPNGLQQQEE